MLSKFIVLFSAIFIFACSARTNTKNHENSATVVTIETEEKKIESNESKKIKCEKTKEVGSRIPNSRCATK